MRRMFPALAPFAMLALIVLRGCGPMEHAVFAASAPTDTRRMDAFAREYNGYARQLSRGVIDLKAWARTERAWKAL